MRSTTDQEGNPVTRARGIDAWLWQPVDPALLVVLRVAIGGVLCWEAVRYLALDRPRRFYESPDILFTWWPFDWVRPLPAPGMTWVFVGLATAAGLVAVGAWFRPAAHALWIGETYVLLLDRTHYLNHWYLACLLTFLLAWTPAGDHLSLDARRAGNEGRRDAVPDRVPAWTTNVFRAQLAVVYVFGGLAKLDTDWLAGRPLSMWLARKRELPVVGSLLEQGWVGPVAAAGSAAFDLLIAPALLHPRWRRFAYVTCLAFHLANSRLFRIGMFPWLMMLLSTVFFPDDFPRRMAERVRGGEGRRSMLAAGIAMGAMSALVPREPEIATALIGAVAGAVAADRFLADRVPADRVLEATRRAAGHVERGSRRVAWALGLWMTVQVLVPLRHLAYPGNASWTEEGHQFAWRMMLRSKQGSTVFHVRDPRSGETWDVGPELVVEDEQAEQMQGDPDMTVQLARYLERRYREELGTGDLEVRVTTAISLNGRDRVPFIDPEVDLTRVPRPWLPPAPWIEDLPG